MPLGGVLKGAEPAWEAYKTRFISDRGRLIDTGNKMISHSEGQGYAMLLAVASSDRPTFDRLWGWTRANLVVRDDSLLAWRWEPNKRPAVSDMNDAADGDILVAWALTEAAEYWNDDAYRAAARRLAVDVGRKLVLTKTPLGMMLLPGVSGFAAEDRRRWPGAQSRPTGSFRPSSVCRWSRRKSIGTASRKAGSIFSKPLVSAAPDCRRNGCPTREGKVRPADGYAQYFGYNAVRVPLYLAWAGVGERDHYAGFVAWAKRTPSTPAIIDVADGRAVQPFGESGYASIGALALCAVESKPLPAEARAMRTNENYYPVTLHLLALAAARMRYPSCLQG